MGIAVGMQFFIGLHYARHDPGAVLPWSGRVCAGADDCGKIVVYAYLCAWGGAKLAQRFAQCVVQAKLLWHQHHAWCRRPPQDGLTLTEPGKNTLGISAKKVLCIQCSASSQQARGRVMCAPGLARVGKRVVWFQPGQGSGHYKRQQDERQGAIVARIDRTRSGTAVAGGTDEKKPSTEVLGWKGSMKPGFERIQGDNWYLEANA